MVSSVSEADAVRLPVVVSGAGPAGLMTSLLLGRYGIRNVVLERRPTTSVLPRATGVNLRSMEIFRTVGLAGQIAAAAMDVSGKPLWVELETLRGPARAERRIDAPSGAPRAGFPSPAAHLQCAQDRLEPILLAAIKRLEACEVRFGAEVIAVDQSECGVTVDVVEADSGRCYTIAGRYLVGADGSNSTVRNAVAIPMEGEVGLGTELSVLFAADLSALVAGHEASLYRVHNPHMRGTFRPVDNRTRWTLTTPSTGAPSPDRCAEMIRAGADDPTLEPQILAIQEWALGTAAAATFRSGSVFLVGDAAHRMTPGGAMGMNTAVQDAHNLAWKLAAVFDGWGGPALLDSYDQERRPVGQHNAALSLAIWNDMNRAGRTVGAVLGFNYETGAIIADGTSLPNVADPVVDFVPCARPGSRAPHHWIDLDGHRRSTIDLFDGTFVLLSPGQPWCAAALDARAAVGVPVTAHQITDPAWAELYGIDAGGAVLVRPDGHVAWRTNNDNQTEPRHLEHVFRKVLGL